MSIFFTEVDNTPAPGARDIAQDATQAATGLGIWPPVVLIVIAAAVIMLIIVFTRNQAKKTNVKGSVNMIGFLRDLRFVVIISIGVFVGVTGGLIVGWFAISDSYKWAVRQENAACFDRWTPPCEITISPSQ